jgi:hypothetical protein
MWIALMKTIGRAPLRDTRTSTYLTSEKENKDAFSASPYDQNKKIDKSDNSE